MNAPPTRLDPRFADAAMRNISMFAGRIASRPHYRPDRSGALILNEAACEHNCAACYLACAIAPDRLAWWERELARVCGSPAMGRC